MAKRRSRRRVSPSPSPAPFPPSIHLTSVYQALAARERDRQVERALQNEELRERIRELRRYVKGFEGSRYHLRYIDDWSEADRTHVIESSKRLRYLISRPHVTVAVPRSKAKRRVLKQFTNQDVREVKRFIVHTEAPPERTRVEFAGKGKQLRMRLHIRSGKTWAQSYRREFFLWRDFNRNKHPVTLKAQRRVLERMLPHMPRGKYAFWTDRHGMTGTPIDRHFLRQRLTEWYHAYETGEQRSVHEGFGRVLTGLVYLGTWRSARSARRKLDKQRSQYQNMKRITTRIRRQKKKDIQGEIDRKLMAQFFGRSEKPVRKSRRKHK